MDITSIKKHNNAGTVTAPAVELNEKEKEVEKFVANRVQEMQDYRKELKIEDEWKEADKEYIPQEIDLKPGRRRFETNQEDGLRSRLVPIGDANEDWRSNNSDPTLLTKIQTAISIIIDNNPEASLEPLLNKYEKCTAVAYALW